MAMEASHLHIESEPKQELLVPAAFGAFVGAFAIGAKLENVMNHNSYDKIDAANTQIDERTATNQQITGQLLPDAKRQGNEGAIKFLKSEQATNTQQVASISEHKPVVPWTEDVAAISGGAFIGAAFVVAAAKGYYRYIKPIRSRKLSPERVDQVPQSLAEKRDSTA